jgi:pyrroline-5-carboxylate reductase
LHLNHSKTISFIGAGNMSKAIISGLVAKGYPANMIMASNPSQTKLDELKANLGIQITNNKR